MFWQTLNVISMILFNQEKCLNVSNFKRVHVLYKFHGSLETNHEIYIFIILTSFFRQASMKWKFSFLYGCYWSLLWTYLPCIGFFLLLFLLTLKLLMKMSYRWNDRLFSGEIFYFIFFKNVRCKFIIRDEKISSFVCSITACHKNTNRKTWSRY